MNSFAQSYAALPNLFHRPVTLNPVASPTWVLRNEKLAETISLDLAWLSSDEALQNFAGNLPLKNSSPIAMAYAGHQFGGFNPLLGDGRALLLGDFQSANGTKFDLHLKGSGPTTFSRNGDGRATLSAMLREYIISEAMAALGIPTTRALAVVATGEVVYRQTQEPGAVLTRLARSHVRVGTFQLAAAHQDHAALRALVDHEMARNFSGFAPTAENLLRQASARQASLIAKWMSVGFIHGVMNTDNMQVAGETIDYGPCAFMDTFHPHQKFSSIDSGGRYAWDKQPTLALWNLTRLAECLLPLLHENQDAAIETAQSILAKFMPAFEQNFETAMRNKLGIPTAEPNDGEFIATTLRFLMEGKVDFTLFFRRLTQHAGGAPANHVQELFNSPDLGLACLAHCNTRRAENAHATMTATNPIFIPRNHRVEEALRAANAGDFTLTRRLISALQLPFNEQPENTDLEEPPTDHTRVTQTFCGT